MSETFDKVVGEFQVEVSEPYPYWITITHDYSDGQVKFEHEQLDDLIYALTQAKARIDEERAAQRRLLQKAAAE